MENITRYTIFKTKWGYFGIVGNETGLVRTCLPTTMERVKSLLLKRLKNTKFDRAFFGEIEEKITAYFEGSYASFGRDIPVVLDGFSEFGKAVLDACRDASFGETISYGQLAERIGRPGAARAVGGVLARNPLPLVIPCHRVVYSDGGLGGFSAFGGITVKKRMLELEKGVVIQTRGFR
jgi:methylated-DNA-[protein]-cysteine S-methyltransferase